MWRNWSGYLSSPHATLLTPASCAEMANALVNGEAYHRPVRAVGAGHSFSPLVCTEGTIVSLDRLQGIVDIDVRRRRVRVQAGTRLATLGEALFAKNLAMENLGDINIQSVAGAINTGTHGTGITLGNLATQVAGFTLMKADGKQIIASKSENPDLFNGGRIALGALGILTEVDLNVVPSFRLRLQRGRMPLEQCLDQAQTIIGVHRCFEFYWLPHTETVLTKSWDVTQDAPSTKNWRRFVAEEIIENTVFGLLCRFGSWLPALCPQISRICASLIRSDEHIAASHQVLSASRKVRFNEMEWALPARHGADALREIKAFISRKKFPLMFPIEVRWVQRDDIWLSPDFERDSMHISVHQYRGMPDECYFDGVQAICLSYGGRPHWGKVHSLDAKELKKLYPRWDDFLSLRERMDPAGVFLTPYLRSLFGLDRRSNWANH
ncbi:MULTISPECIES: D-arabinono-1,4-lactone oxidase [unclassified Burkholderia]|uniref:D-arabinono-1,4-lactone oxidase n=1 Tax=unclassified Burkholderia TaxID=2613784 RepID=UPI000F581D32|nr:MULTISPECIES: D-arabinono-1,4-lactone oxidase [unclassified Burkholderia]RQS26495.1 FAD-binding protein [Burkholderia sp. Bp8995]RQS48473.1 FAD-binding protein [Burkholderia sp. Bp8989]